MGWSDEFAEISRKQRGGGSKTPSSDQIEWQALRGSYAGARLLRSTWRPDVPGRQFLTPATARLRTPFLEEYGGEHLLLEVISAVGLVDVNELARLAQTGTDATVYVETRIGGQLRGCQLPELPVPGPEVNPFTQPAQRDLFE